MVNIIQVYNIALEKDELFMTAADVSSHFSMYVVLNYISSTQLTSREFIIALFVPNLI
jgi:hypothetical protein